jgi:hypothetical protein
MKYPGYGHKTIFSIMGKIPMELLQKFHPAFLACTATGREIGFVPIAYIFSRVINFVNFRTYCDEAMCSSLHRLRIMFSTVFIGVRATQETR